MKDKTVCFFYDIHNSGQFLSWSLGWLVVEHNCVNIGVFIDFVGQLHVSAFIGHRQVVLREVKEFH